MRKLATAAAVSLVLASGGVRALGLGDIEMRSALNQPMNAEIRLTSVQPGEADGMIVKLASPDAFSRAGIERTSSLTDLRFSVDQSGSAPVIRISSNRPVVEPFLNFLLEVDWPSGRMVREYTVLLDPPVFMTPSASSSNVTTEQPAILQRSDASLNAPTPIERDTFAADSFEVEVVGSAVEISDNAVLPTDGGDVVSLDDLGSAATDSTLGSVQLIDDSAVSFDTLNGDGGEVVVLSDLEVSNTDAAGQFQADQLASSDFEFDVEIVGGSNEVSDTFVLDGQSIGDSSDIVSLDSLDSEVALGSGGGQVTVQRGDTLAQIARANAVQGVSSQQMMMALLNANQSSFIDGNVNLVKAGAILRIPDGSELTQLSQADAVAQMGEQNQLWREYRDNIRGSSGTRVAASQQPAPQQPSESAKTELSDAAQRILDAAKDEALGTKELNIVAETDSTTTVASATADNTQGSADAQLGQINKKLQLAKEELAATRSESVDLDEQSAELQSTTENMESLVGIRQQEVARLQEQLKAASQDTDAAGLVDNAGDAVADAAGNVTDAAGNATDAAQNALAAGGEKLPEVELVPDVNAPEVDIAPPAVQTPWYTDLLQKYGKWLVIGIGALCALGLGLLLLGKRRKKDDDMLDYGDDVEFLDDEDDGVQLHTADEFEQPESSPGIGSAVATGVAGAAAVGGVTAAARANADDENTDAGLDAHMDAMDEANVQDNLDPDDTISEVDVYLAYGLHGQAEELLAKAIEREPDNPEYALKLLQTQHAQGNGDAFSEGAESYYERFGGEGAPEWAAVCEMGYDLQPNNILFASSDNAVENVGMGNHEAPKLDDSDFDPAAGAVASAGSVSRDFGTASDTPVDANESDLMDQSLDPAFAFDETDLEATGDFSQIANEIADEEVSVGGDSLGGDSLVDDTSLDFPGFDAGDSVGDKLGDIAGAGKDKLGDAGSSLKGGIGAGIGAVAAGGAAVAGGLGSKAASAKESASGMFDDALSLDDLDSGGAANDGVQSLGQGSVAEDLTLDLDQLSGDLELDGTDLLDDSTASVDGLEMPDLTSDNDLINDNINELDGSDEMDTMMDLAKAYIDMGDKDSASSALGEIVKSGNPAQKVEAETLLRKIS